MIDSSSSSRASRRYEEPALRQHREQRDGNWHGRNFEPPSLRALGLTRSDVDSNVVDVETFAGVDDGEVTPQSIRKRRKPPPSTRKTQARYEGKAKSLSTQRGKSGDCSTGKFGSVDSGPQSEPEKPAQNATSSSLRTRVKAGATVSRKRKANFDDEEEAPAVKRNSIPKNRE